MKSYFETLKELEKEFPDLEISINERDNAGYFPAANGYFFSPGFSSYDEWNEKKYEISDLQSIKNLWSLMIKNVLPTKIGFQKTLLENSPLKKHVYCVFEYGVEHEVVETEDKIFYYIKNDKQDFNSYPCRFFGPHTVSKNKEESESIYCIDNKDIKDKNIYYNHPEIKKLMEKYGIKI